MSCRLSHHTSIISEKVRTWYSTKSRCLWQDFPNGHGEVPWCDLVVNNQPAKQETPVRSLVWENPTGGRATKPMGHS